MNSRILSACCLALATSSPSLAADPVRSDRPDAVTVAGKSEQPWEMICHVLPVGDSENSIVLNNGHQSFTGNVRRLDCDFKRSMKAPLVVSIAPAGFKCPFESDDASTCTKAFDKKVAGSFELKNR